MYKSIPNKSDLCIAFPFYVFCGLNLLLYLKIESSKTQNIRSITMWDQTDFFEILWEVFSKVKVCKNFFEVHQLTNVDIYKMQAI